uniref:Uncharacterized protein n=1 Tax=Lotus japonicus TaxID=34305 RepID=I3T723_LOTJA|nr:unknown [Lotus japonicus]
MGKNNYLHGIKTPKHSSGTGFTSTLVHVINDFLIVFKKLRPLLLVCWSDKVTFHVKWYWVKMNCSYKLKTFQLLFLCNL